ncbi:MAG TPA: hypothetical protein VGI76_02395 [Solirubrobacteraceae bacterium]
MVIVVCRDDRQLVGLAQTSSANHGFGGVFKLDTPQGQVPPLGAGEDLFIIAHGAVTDPSQPGNAMIGNQKAGGYGYNAVDLFARLVKLGIFPQGYRGDVYISACYSADWLTTRNDAGFSFIEVFTAQIDSKICGYKGRVYGHRGEVEGEIPPPGDQSWIRPQV